MPPKKVPTKAPPKSVLPRDPPAWDERRQMLVYSGIVLGVCWGVYGTLNGHELINLWFEGTLYVGEGPEVDVEYRTYMAYAVQLIPTIASLIMIFGSPSLTWRRDGWGTLTRWPKGRGLKFVFGAVLWALAYNITDWLVARAMGLEVRRWNVIKPKTYITATSLPAVMAAEGGLAFFLVPLFVMRFRMTAARAGVALGVCSFMYSLPAFLGTAYMEGATEVLPGMTWLLCLFFRSIFRSMNVAWMFAATKGSMGLALWYLANELFVEGSLMRITMATVEHRIMGQAVHVGVGIVFLILLTVFSPSSYLQGVAPPPPWVVAAAARKKEKAAKKTQ